MRNLLRISLLSVFAVAFTSLAFADGKDVSGKIWNGDAEQGLSGWEVTFSTDNNVDGRIWKISNHTEGTGAGSMGYWGFNSHCLEIWAGQTDGIGNPVGKNSISQVVSDLPNGTYVFGAFTIATIQSHGTSENKTKYIPTKGDVEGVYMFANDVKSYIATNDPEAADSLPEAHAVKLNVAAQVIDGTLKFGFGAEEGTPASFICFDNATLYYFGDVEPDAALAEAYKMDLQKAVAASDTLKKYPMAAAVLAELNAAGEAAADANGVEACMAAEENVRLASLAARISINQYKRLVDAINHANSVLEQEWSSFVEDQLNELKEATAKAEEDLKAGELVGDELTAYIDDFNNTINKVEIDELYDLLDALEQFINDFESISDADPNLFCGGSHPGFGEEVGQYPYSEQEKLAALLEEAQELEGAISDESVPASQGVAMIEKIKSEVAATMANANKEPVLPFDAILVPDPNDPTKPLLRTSQSGLASDAAITPYKQTSLRGGADEVFRYESPVFGLPYAVDKLVITVTHTIYNDRPRDEGYNDGPYFNLTEFYLFDENGEEITLSAEDFGSNAKEPNEGSYAGLLDGDTQTFFHSRWSSKNNETGYHTLEITMPEDLYKFSFAMEVIFNDTRISNMPTEIVVSGMTHTAADLSAAISDAEGLAVMGYVQGDEPGFNSGDFTKIFALKEALSAAKAVLNNEESTDEELVAATEALELAAAEADGVEGLDMNLPKPGVAYKLANQAPFVSGQGKVKNMTVFQDSILWWADADPADAYQDFTFEKVDGPDEEDLYFHIKNVKTGKYIGLFTEQPGFEGDNEIIWGNNWHIRLSDTPAPIRMRSLGFGQVHFWSAEDVDETAWLGIHACNHNSGSATTRAGDQGGGKGFSDAPDGYSIHGVCGPIVQWGTDAYGASAWYIRQQEELPLSILTGAGFEKVPHHLYQPVDIMTIQADKACAFANLQLTDILGEPIEYTAEQSDAVSTVITFAKHTESFYLSFDNAEGVGTVTVTGGVAEKSELAKLQEAYDAVAGTEYTEGSDIGCVKSLAALNAALAKAESLLQGSAATDEEFKAAREALTAAVDGLEVVMPEEGKSYFLVNAFDVFEQNFGTTMALFSNPDNGMPGWTYISINNPNYEWQFEYVDDEKKDFRLFNVGTQDYISGSTGGDHVMTASNGGKYTLIARGNQKFNILNTDEGASNDGSASGTWMIHAKNHNGGANPFGSICMWGNDNPTKSEWYIKESGTVKTSIDEVSVEPENLSGIANGTYDLTGRRVANPEKGLYIMNGKKVLVK